MSGAAVEQACPRDGGSARALRRPRSFALFLALSLARSLTTAGLLLGPMSGGGCHRAPAGHGAVFVRPGDPVVARVGGTPITATDVAAQMVANPGLDRRGALEQRILFEVLARAAADEELPAATSDERAALVAAEAQRLIERDLEPQLAPSAISDGDVRAL